MAFIVEIFLKNTLESQVVYLDFIMNQDLNKSSTDFLEG